MPDPLLVDDESRGKTVQINTAELKDEIGGSFKRQRWSNSAANGQLSVTCASGSGGNHLHPGSRQLHLSLAARSAK